MFVYAEFNEVLVLRVMRQLLFNFFVAHAVDMPQGEMERKVDEALFYQIVYAVFLRFIPDDFQRFIKGRT